MLSTPRTIAVAPSRLRRVLRVGVALSSLFSAACSHAAPPASSVAPPVEVSGAPGSCGDARAVPLDGQTASSPAFRQLRGLHRARLAFACPSAEPCSLPPDTQIEFGLAATRPEACEFAACRVPYLGSLPFAESSEDPCPNVLWSVHQVTLKSDAITLDEQATDVNVLASPKGEAYLRFTVENPAALARVVQKQNPSAAPQTTMLDVQLEIANGNLRGQLSALAAPLPTAPATDLRFTALWTATWQLPLAP